MTTINEAHEEGGTNTLLLVGDNGKNTSSQGRKDEESADMNNNNNNDALVNDKVEACSKQIGSNSSSVEAVSIYEDKTAATTTTSSSSNHESSSSSSNEEKEIMISSTTIDKTFLPLIENKNIIHVENIPYVKLGIIGKGGSCKVYRALSPDCTVVALKKVKLDGLNQCAIDGYANEIALLKRLRGNPAIIQLYSAEVDLNRKSILLVMELGEVDLNYVLRQQALSSSSSSKQKQGSSSSRGGGIVSSLNMNFIRLTWQQMLTAVHSIHEERIIHSDLKPANFLFVRGALKLIDFGIAKAIEREDTTNVYRETLSGTLSYMSPEAIMDTSTNVDGVRVNRCGRPSDIWSLGCILYQMVYGKTPFADYVGISQKVLAITNVNHEIHFPDGVDESSMDAMKLCLQRDPKLRPPIIGVNGLLNEHCFLHGKKKKITTDQR
jgi:serine/threonine-protein kinase RIO1